MPKLVNSVCCWGIRGWNHAEALFNHLFQNYGLPEDIFFLTVDLSLFPEVGRLSSAS